MQMPSNEPILPPPAVPGVTYDTVPIPATNETVLLQAAVLNCKP